MTEDLKNTTTSRDLLAKEITERKQADEELRESEEKYRTILESIEEIYFEVDISGNFTFFNDSLSKSLGYSKNELMGMNNRDYMTPESSKKIFNLFNQIYKTGNPIKKVSYEIIRKDGSHGFHELFASLMKNNEGQPIGFRGIAHDITELKKTEDALRESEEKYRTILENIEDGYYEVDIAGNFTFFNDSMCKISGYPRDELIGMNCQHYISKEDIQKVYKFFKKVLITGNPAGIGSHELIRKDGTKGYIELSASLIKDAEGQRIGFRGIIRDITERKRAEEELKGYAAKLERSNQELEQFAYIASHDLQEPLRMVASYTQLLARRYKGKLDSDADEFIFYAVDGATRMKALINGLLTYSRIGARGKDFEPTDCEAVLGCTLDNLQKAIEESDVKVTHDPLPTVMADDMQLGQLFQNLIGNAIKFRSEEHPSIHVSCERIEESAIGNRQSAMNKWVFSVRDNGVGIDPELTGRIFIIFQRLHKRGEYPGTGIGLAICKKIVERHGGRIWVESDPGKGSTFYFTIPLRGENSHGK